MTQPIICYFYTIVVTYVNRAHTHLGKGKEEFCKLYSSFNEERSQV